ncbi:UNVERIFIED_CONTAM: hypothetical protein PYX00_010595 [Menopon gallinae]|uniref:t-SNARE coiled-coil homology domain-containing protein n=1 Tax=Menopon gallinae TaxID=328185 RepID=A0AAW2HFX7_9NEOP
MALNSKNYASYGATAVDPEVIVQPSDSREIREICENITANIENINTHIRNFTAVSEQIGTPNDSPALRDQILVKIMSSNQLVKSSQKGVSKLNSLSRGANKQEKLQIQRLTGLLKDIAERNFQTQQTVLDKIRNNVLMSPDRMESSGDQASLLQADQMQIQRNLEFEQGLLLERQQRIRQIENQIFDANELMKELSALISDQGEKVDSIEREIENVNENIQLGRNELSRAAEYAARARKRKLILLSILAIVLIVLIGIIIWSST